MTAPTNAAAPAAGMHGLQVRALRPADRDALLALHRKVFASEVDTRWYDWKYAVGHGCGSGAWAAAYRGPVDRGRDGSRAGAAS